MAIFNRDKAEGACVKSHKMHTQTHTLAGFKIMKNRTDLYLDKQNFIQSINQFSNISYICSMHNSFYSAFKVKINNFINKSSASFLFHSLVLSKGFYLYIKTDF